MVLWKRCERSAGKSIGDKANTLLELFKQAFLVYQLEEYSTMLKPGSTAVPKMYAVDQGMVYAVSRANQQDIGKRLETAIFCELQRRTSGRRTETITSYTMPTSKQEKVDFSYRRCSCYGTVWLIQVCANMGNEKTRREKSALCKRLCNVPTLIPA